MSFLDMLWDETLAGPKPDTGLGKLRKYNSLSAVRSPPPIILHDVPISRSITILKTNSTCRNFSSDSGSNPDSPAGTSTPGSPFTPGTPSGDLKRLTRKKVEACEGAEPRSPTVYDWFSLFVYFFNMTFLLCLSGISPKKKLIKKKKEKRNLQRISNPYRGVEVFKGLFG